jgi:hypothetical protein
MQRRKEEEEVE